MDYIDSIQKSIDILELSLTKEISIDSVASQVYISKYHFYRIFSAIVGVPPMEYVRRRRLSEAASRLINTKERIIDIAFEYGFESHETFTRAFKQYFSLTPAQFRKEKPKIWLYDKCNVEYCKIKIKNINGGSEMEMKIVEGKEIKIVGMIERIVMPNNTIPQLWDKFMPRIKEIKNIVGCGSYGIAQNMSETDESYSFDEIVGVEVSSFEDIPEGMITTVIKPQKYVVFTHKGELFEKDGGPKLHKTYDYIYGKWLPTSGYKVDEGFNFEYYDERFKPDSPESEMDIYVPVK